MRNINSKEQEDCLDISAMTDEMKYIKWPSFKAVMSDLASVIILSAIIVMILTAGDSLGSFLIGKISDVLSILL